MKCADFTTACRLAGVDFAQPARVIDATIAAMLEVEERTARRWRLGMTDAPGPVRVALRCMARLHNLGFTAQDSAAD